MRLRYGKEYIRKEPEYEECSKDRIKEQYQDCTQEHGKDRSQGRHEDRIQEQCQDCSEECRKDYG